jgi:hypothetical protein
MNKIIDAKQGAGLVLILSISLTAIFSTPVTAETVEFSEGKVIIEINATDGDVGFHALFDADAWKWVAMTDPEGNRIFTEKASENLREQGLTENFFESAEPLCEEDEEEPDELVVTLGEFLLRFPEGDYRVRANNNEGDRVLGFFELTYNLPAMPDTSLTEEEMAIDEVVIAWMPGTDLGDACHDQDLVDDGIIPDPGSVEVVGWEVVVVAADDEASDPERHFSIQLPPEITSISVPEVFFQPFVDSGFTEMKFEVGAIEESGNQTFAEGEFEISID